ncbi:hypothetical protein [Ralstonia solanacearum]|uniref:Uncharacterized protein n=2 Tax=Ralstonia solanacearum TaxID=305 RepID=A0A5H2PQN1_RALSL|nr:hypothetical protein [Ralstonia solanacearum]AEG70030.1 hypothetical protein RSPO_c02738 [Ralstonia solanacearum Po82]AMP68180.1 hypothetical protein UW163_01165 [Ralstonia solanacearum]AMP74916.1 hypothetical protein RALBFv3_12395 [Ralstonia solanacearum]AYB61466.1 hypothetical protein C2124_13365 [Ralstonia solanacearum]EUJ13965.1 hypothetical protein RSP673_13125 [Ralstonia solanacearum P673]
MQNPASPGRVLVLLAAALALPCAAQTSAPAAQAATERPAQYPVVRGVSYNESHVIGLDGKDVSTVAMSVQVLKIGARGN